MGKNQKKSDVQTKKAPGVLYIRYDKNTFCGQIIEKLKEKSSQQLNKRVLNLIFLFEIVEPLNYLDVDLETLNEAYYKSLRLFSDKLEQTYYKLNRLTEQRTRQKNREAISPLTGETEAKNSLAFLTINNLIAEDSMLPAVQDQNIKSSHS